jgi:hypothetical protein
MSAPTVDFEHRCWNTEYLFAHCEGYRVESDGETLGYVEEVLWSADGSEPLALRVVGDDGRVTITLGDAVALHPDREAIVVQTPLR